MLLSHIQSRLDLSRDGNLDLDTGLEGDGSLSKKVSQDATRASSEITYDLLDDLAGGVEVNETLVDLHLEAVASL